MTLSDREVLLLFLTPDVPISLSAGMLHRLVEYAFNRPKRGAQLAMHTHTMSVDFLQMDKLKE